MIKQHSNWMAEKISFENQNKCLKITLKMNHYKNQQALINIVESFSLNQALIFNTFIVIYECYECFSLRSKVKLSFLVL